MKIQGEINTTIAGIPCQILIKAGYEGDYEYSVRDRKGYAAGWLEKKVTPEEESEIQLLISDYKDAQRSEQRAYNRHMRREDY